MRRLLRKLEARGLRLCDTRALEVFGGSGDLHTLEYAPRVASLEVWEIDERHRATLEATLPSATLRFGDSYQMLHQTTSTYDMIVADNPMSNHGDHCEHFDLFPHIFSLVGACGVIVTDVIPYVDSRALDRFPYLFNAEQLKRRADFYNTATPEHVPLESMPVVYEEYASRAGYRIDWHLFQRRHFVHYLAMMAVRL